MKSENRISFQKAGETAYIIDADKGLVRIGRHVFAVDMPDVCVNLPSTADMEKLSSFPAVQVAYSGKHFASMALNTYLKNAEKIRDVNMKLNDVREILPSYLQAYKSRSLDTKQSNKDIQGEDENQQNTDRYSQENLKIIKSVLGN